MFFWKYCEVFKRTYFEVDLRTTTSVIFQICFPENLQKIALDFTIFQFCFFFFVLLCFCIFRLGFLYVIILR